MKTIIKMNLENIQGKLNRAEMRNIMAGSGLVYGRCCVGTNCGNQPCAIWITCPSPYTYIKCY